MNKKKILCIFGTRPEAIKMLPIIQLLKQRIDHFTPIVCVTAQHRSMLDDVMDLHGIKPDIDLDIMRPQQTLASVTEQILNKVTEEVKQTRPDIMLVHGDTATAYAAALAGFYLDIPIGHIEAGLRTGDRKNPFPEEFYRTSIGLLASYHFAPTQHAKENLLDELGENTNILVTGNTVIDALMNRLKKYEKSPSLEERLKLNLSHDLGLKIDETNYVLVTGHRRENHGNGILEVCKALLRLVNKYEKLSIIFPVHLNPNVKDRVYSILGGHDKIVLCEPLDYDHFLVLMKNCFVVLTDSGGIQEEGPSLGKPVFVTRVSTERPEGLISGTSILVGTNQETIIDEISQVIDNPVTYELMARKDNPYGDGNAAKRVVKFLEEL